MVFLLLSTPGVSAQSGAGTARLGGQVSGAVAVSAAEGLSPDGGARVSAANVDAATIAVTISSPGDREARVRLPLRLRSNVGYTLRASLLSADELGVRLSVAHVEATGRFVHANALADLTPGEALAPPRAGSAPFLSAHNHLAPIALLSGPPVSKAGTFTSPDNAIEVVLSVELRPRPGVASWSTRLTITAAPAR